MRSVAVHAERSIETGTDKVDAATVREMIASGDWLTPRLNGFKYFEKPALQYWATAAAFGAFGQNEWAARLWPGLAGFFGVLLVFWTGNRLFGPPIGLYGALVAASSAMYVLIGHFLSLDMALAFFMSASVFAIALAQRDESGDKERRRWMLIAWAAAALMSSGSWCDSAWGRGPFAPPLAMDLRLGYAALPMPDCPVKENAFTPEPPHACVFGVRSLRRSDVRAVEDGAERTHPSARPSATARSRSSR